MKTALSLPDEVFERAERLARRLGTSRSRLYAEAIAEYVAKHSPDPVTEKMNEVCDQLGSAADPLVLAAAARTLATTQW